MKVACRLCGTPSGALGEVEGYRAGTFFDVMGCSGCGTNFTLPTGPYDEVYEAIYKNVAVVPGYSRYLHHAQQVLREKDPLRYLMNCEDCYWGIAQTILAGMRGHPSDNHIWEVGCGQGYLTYALVKAGFNAIGLDISETAIASARRRYGAFFFCESASTFFLRTKARPSFIVLSEVIEHLPDPISFIAELVGYLQPGGAIIVTTPNKEVRPPDAIWDTELPPVHLWWFTVKGLESLAGKLSCRVEFTNLEEFYSENLRFRKKSGGDPYRRVPTLDSKYHVITRAEHATSRLVPRLKSIVKRVIPRKVLRRIQLKRAALSGLEECTSSPPISLCAVYSAFR